MTSTQRRADLGMTDAQWITAQLAGELRDARVSAGLSQADAGRAAGLSRSQWGRLEREEVARPDLVQICCAGRALGLRASIKYYPAGSPVRDAAQLSLLSRFEKSLGAPLRLRREVPLPIDGDLRAWDGMVEGDGSPFFTEGETRLGDAQAVERRIRLKQRDDPRAGTVILIVTRSSHNRRVLAEHREALRDLLPLDGYSILRAVRRGRRPGASGIVLL